MDVEKQAREVFRQLFEGSLANSGADDVRIIAAALTEAHAAGAEPYAREALLVLSGAGIPTPERGYVADGGAGLMGGDLRKLWAAGRRAGLGEAARLCRQDAETFDKEDEKEIGRWHAARIVALKDKPHGR